MLEDERKGQEGAAIEVTSYPDATCFERPKPKAQGTPQRPLPQDQAIRSGQGTDSRLEMAPRREPIQGLGTGTPLFVFGNSKHSEYRGYKGSFTSTEAPCGLAKGLEQEVRGVGDKAGARKSKNPSI
jgi:hypothetical protein